MTFSKIPKNQRLHGKLGPKASQVYDGIRRDHPSYPDRKTTAIADAVAHHRTAHQRKGRRS